MSPRLAFAIEAAYLAGRGTLGHFQTGLQVEMKRDETPVTNADREAERMIRRRIAESYPGEAILGEEEGETGSSSDRWIIDPIDGTKSFLSGVPLYATLLSFERDGEPQVGVCYLPALDEMLYAEKGGGAFFNGRPCRVSDKGTVAGSVFVCGAHGSMARCGRSEALNRIAESALATRTWSDAYGHALVATGRAEAMLDPTVSRWDVSPMVLIVREAGGRSTNFSGGDPFAKAHADGNSEVVSSNGRVHDEVLGYFR